MKNCAATIGFFDGVHRGHLSLVGQLKEWARSVDATSMVVTMDQHPLQVLHTSYVPQLLCPFSRKLELLRASGVDRVEVLHFTPQIASLRAREFMQRVLKGKMGVTHLLMGYDHHFGHDRGTEAQYVAWGRECGIVVEKAYKMEGEEVSSSRIRHLLAKGDMPQATKLLGRPYELIGQVIRGYQLGRKLGFPTANLRLTDPLQMPAHGVYAVRVILPDGRLCRGMLNVGVRPTLNNGEEVSMEVNIFDFTEKIYEKHLILQLLLRLRDETRFPSLEALKTQLKKDRHMVESLFAGYGENE